jgi:hypothetical protein
LGGVGYVVQGEKGFVGAAAWMGTGICWCGCGEGRCTEEKEKESGEDSGVHSDGLEIGISRWKVEFGRKSGRRSYDWKKVI